MCNFDEYLKSYRGLLIAPAGHGKTTAIADCIKRCPDDQCQLILTHTHAGIASLREKLRKKKIPVNKYHLETITGIAQRYVLSYLGSAALPKLDEKEYFDKAVKECIKLLQSSVVQIVVKSSYKGIFVDEYQDCTVEQHHMIMELARQLPLHLLGDPLQGIFSFVERPLVDFDFDLASFKRFRLLDYPWRWVDTNPYLGQQILDIRNILEQGCPIKLEDNQQAGFCVVDTPTDEKEKYNTLRRLINQHNCDSMLIICPSYHEYDKRGKMLLRGDVNNRIKIKQRVDFENSFCIIDAIDGAAYYSCARMIDSFIEKHGRINEVSKLCDIMKSLHLNTSEVRKWIDKERNRFKNRKKEKVLSDTLKNTYKKFQEESTLENLREVIRFIINLPSVKCYHKNLYRAIDSCFSIAIANNTKMYEAMVLLKNRVRHQGRRIEGKCIASTLLTKGLEFDTVIIWEAHKFEDAENFYVAISRARKKLIILTEQKTMTFGDRRHKWKNGVYN